MSNELLTVLLIGLEIVVVFGARQLGKRWSFSTIALNLILVSIFGQKLIEIFGFVTNAGNVFYASVFFATQLMLEKKTDENEGIKTIWFGAAFVGLFIILSQLVLNLTPIVVNLETSQTLAAALKLSPRIALASILAYLFAQYIHVWVYLKLKAKFQGQALWLRANLANITAQLVDSLLFFTIAFIDLPADALIQAVFIGLAVKTATLVLATPLIYLDRRLPAN